MNKILITLIALLSTHSFADKTELTLKFNGLTKMIGQHYEGWNIVNGVAESTGRFAVTSKGHVVSVNKNGDYIKKIGKNGYAKFLVPESQRQSSLFVLTIEPNNDQDDSPSSVHLFGGKYTNEQATLSIDHQSSIGTNFSNSEGSVILAAPSGGEDNQGVWFLNPSNGKSSLDLPELPNGWAYEGWIVNQKNNKKFSTGIFIDPNGNDSDNAGLLAGPLKLDTPNLPGQDIVKSSVVLDDGIHSIVVTVEPYPDYDPRPFDIKILKHDIKKLQEGKKSLNLNNIAEDLPAGKVYFNTNHNK